MRGGEREQEEAVPFVFDWGVSVRRSLSSPPPREGGTGPRLLVLRVPPLPQLRPLQAEELPVPAPRRAGEGQHPGPVHAARGEGRPVDHLLQVPLGVLRPDRRILRQDPRERGRGPEVYPAVPRVHVQERARVPRGGLPIQPQRVPGVVRPEEQGLHLVGPRLGRGAGGREEGGAVLVRRKTAGGGGLLRAETAGTGRLVQREVPPHGGRHPVHRGQKSGPGAAGGHRTRLRKRRGKPHGGGRRGPAGGAGRERRAVRDRGNHPPTRASSAANSVRGQERAKVNRGLRGCARPKGASWGQ
mmetsp:Transcript_7580/g.18267  ORF Transcript_7580/g.18267 Transcript_7580/m.18267 type:complete len:300 (-) Transcript_7580:1263-2162(-)